MIPKFVILILLPILLTVVYLGSADENIVGLIALALMMVSFFCTIVVKSHVFGALFLIVALHWFQLEGISHSIYLMFVAVTCYALYMTHMGDQKVDRLWLLLAASQFGYMALVFLARPYTMMMIFFFVMATGLVFFLGCGLIRWTSSMVQKVITAHLVFMCIWAFIERAVSFQLRVEGPSLSSTNFAVLLAVSWTIWFMNGWISKKTNPVWLGVISVLVFISIVLSGTRMGIIGMGLGSMLTVLAKLMMNQRERVLSMLFKFVILSGILAILAIGLWSFLPDDMFLKQGMNTFVSGRLDASSMGRIAAWYTAGTIIKSHTLWGVGPGNFLAYNVEFLARYNMLPIVQTLPRLGHAHNLALMVLSEHGFIGFTFLSMVCVTCAVKLLRYIRYTWDGFGLALLGGGIVMLFLGVFDVFPLFPSSLGWGAWYMGVLFSLGKESRV